MTEANAKERGRALLRATFPLLLSALNGPAFVPINGADWKSRDATIGSGSGRAALAVA